MPNTSQKQNSKPLIVIVGPTASGKTALALEIAQKFNGEIICADSRTVYKGLDIGTAKPILEERAEVQHYLLDIVSPDQSFSAAKFKSMAKDAITEIELRGKLAIMVGGSGLYIDAVLYDFQFLPQADESERQRLDQMSIQELQQEVIDKKLPMPVNSQNRRHLARVIETNGATSSRRRLRDNTVIIGLAPELSVLKQRITNRVNQMIDSGFLDETKEMARKYGWDAPGLLSTGYKAFRDYIENKMSLDEAKEQFVRNDYLLARRQRTWFKRNKSIQWVNNREAAVDIVTTFLNKKQ